MVGARTTRHLGQLGSAQAGFGCFSPVCSKPPRARQAKELVWLNSRTKRVAPNPFGVVEARLKASDAVCHERITIRRHAAVPQWFFLATLHFTALPRLTLNRNGFRLAKRLVRCGLQKPDAFADQINMQTRIISCLAIGRWQFELPDFVIQIIQLLFKRRQ